MLRKAEERRRHAPAEIRQRLKFIEGDMRIGAPDPSST